MKKNVGYDNLGDHWFMTVMMPAITEGLKYYVYGDGRPVSLETPITGSTSHCDGARTEDDDQGSKSVSNSHANGRPWELVISPFLATSTSTMSTAKQVFFIGGQF